MTAIFIPAFQEVFFANTPTHAVHDYIVDKAGLVLGLDVQIHIYPMLDAILGISKTNEEGARPHGSLTFIEPRFLKDIQFSGSISKFRTTSAEPFQTCA